ncbi:MAG: GNAT family N-acetyltransferase [Ruminococcaceae bacterium]|nr:GNAT family N-acetyltransferase [Oscillospiraceae bacterium]
MTNKEIWAVALRQSAIDLNCQPEDFERNEPLITVSAASPDARKYLPLPFVCDMVSYGSNVVATIHPQYRDIVERYLVSYPAGNAFETPYIHELSEAFLPHGLDVCFMAEYFLPDVERLQALPCTYELKTLHPEDFSHLYTEEWSNALCANRRHLDVLAVGAYDGETLIGLAGCSADCDSMWQIGVDVLPEYRRQGIASALTSRLALEILERGKVPFYCCAWCNMKSARNAVRSGFTPAWAELTVRSTDLIKELNKR